MNNENYNTTILYHCSNSANLADEPLKPFDGSASPIRGLCFAEEGLEDQFGPYTYRACLKGDFLTTDLTWNLMLADDEGMEKMGRDGEPIHLTMTKLREACQEAMGDMGIRLEEDVIDFVFERAIENDDCIEFNLDEYGDP